MWMRTRRAAVLAAVGVALWAGGSSAAQPQQVVEGNVVVLTGGLAKTGPHHSVDGQRLHNGLTQFVFDVDPRTRGKRFSLQGLPGGTAGSQDAYAITFYDKRNYEIGTVNATYGGFKPETGIVPRPAAYALVYTEFGLNMKFRYRAG